MAAQIETTTSAQPPAPKVNAFNKDLLRVYYSKLFPFDLWYSWFAYDTSYLLPPSTGDSKNDKSASNHNKLAPTNFRFREISFTSDIEGEEIYSRFLSYNTREEFRNAVLKRMPHKIDIGGVYPYAPKDKNSRPKGSKFKATTKELVFDVDLTDYDGVRLCGCSGANICIKCWQMMNMAIKVMDAGLREDFGFKHLAWIYSGRRGVHCWVADPQAFELDDAARAAVVAYFDVSELGRETHELVLL
jgi:DNA primase small subunit